MPCYEVNLVSVEFKAQNEELLRAAAQSLGWNYYTADKTKVLTGPLVIDLLNKKATGDQTEINTLKRAYSTAAVKAAAKAKGWTLDSWKEKNQIKSTVAVKW